MWHNRNRERSEFYRSPLVVTAMAALSLICVCMRVLVSRSALLGYCWCDCVDNDYFSTKRARRAVERKTQNAAAKRTSSIECRWEQLQLLILSYCCCCCWCSSMVLVCSSGFCCSHHHCCRWKTKVNTDTRTSPCRKLTDCWAPARLIPCHCYSYYCWSCCGYYRYQAGNIAA